MKLNRAISKHARSRVWGWSTTRLVWEDAECFGRLQVYDRFISERNFGQKKRILTLGRGVVPVEYKSIRIGDDETVFLIEHSNYDIHYEAIYGRVYSLRETPHHCVVRKETLSENAAGIKKVSGAPTDLFETWIDIERMSAAASRTFEEAEFSIVTITFPVGSPVTTDCYVVLDDGSRYNIDEAYLNLDAVQVKAKRVSP